MQTWKETVQNVVDKHNSTQECKKQLLCRRSHIEKAIVKGEMPEQRFLTIAKIC